MSGIDNELLLLSGTDIPFIEATLIIHQPTLKEISFLGEARFLTGCDILTFTKEKKFSQQDRIKLSNYSNFNILMTMLTDKKSSMKKQDLESVQMLMELLFPQYIVSLTPVGWIFTDAETQQLAGQINNDNFEIFSQIINKMFCLEKTTGQTEYNPVGKTAEKIAEKFRKARQKLATMKGNSANKVAIYSRYASILAISEKIDLNIVMRYTVYQLFDQFSRSQLKNDYDNYIKARLAGAKDMKDPEDWRKDLDESPEQKTLIK